MQTRAKLTPIPTLWPTGFQSKTVCFPQPLAGWIKKNAANIKHKSKCEKTDFQTCAHKQKSKSDC